MMMMMMMMTQAASLALSRPGRLEVSYGEMAARAAHAIRNFRHKGLVSDRANRSHPLHTPFLIHDRSSSL
jgi:hypothetical protein